MTNGMHGGAEKPLYQWARELRNNATDAETVLWGYLKTKPFGIKFRRQHPYSIYILDFYCHALKLVIEVDDSIHNKKDVKANDILRQEHLENDGFSFIRFTNYEVPKNLESTISSINTTIKKLTDGK
ncbi:MAG: endonuclease domain-containing protein [Chitinophagaceae bacterium]|nr:endonuclease domain-containing protein [Chitinophagaceae bacterium]